MSDTEVITHDHAVAACERAPTLVERAIEKGCDLDTIGRLLEMQERQDARNAKRAFDAAMARALANMPNIAKATKADRYKYEQLTDVVSAVRGPLSAEGLSFRWKFAQDERMVRVTCVISHGDGHVEETTLCAPAEGPRGTNAVQAVGATVTYLERYTLKAALGVAAGEEDTDGRPPAEPREAEPDMDRIGPFMERIQQASGHDDLRDIYRDAKQALTGVNFEHVKRAVTAQKDTLEAA